MTGRWVRVAHFFSFLCCLIICLYFQYSLTFILDMLSSSCQSGNTKVTEMMPTYRGYITTKMYMDNINRHIIILCTFVKPVPKYIINVVLE